jgi:hypothetical protein
MRDVVCPKSTLGILSMEMSSKSRVNTFFQFVPEWLRVVFTFTEEVFHGLYFSVSLTVWIRTHSGFERFVVCLYCAIKDLECCFASF